MTGTAGQVWQQMREFVLERNDRRREVADAAGLSYVRVKALRRIAAEPLTLGELADFLVNDRPYTTLVVNALERRGLVVRTPHPLDRRRKIVTATADGKAVLHKANAVSDAPPDALCALSEHELATLRKLLDKLT